MKLDKTLYERKSEILDYYRHRASESLQQIRELYGVDQFKKRASAVNEAIRQTRSMLLEALDQRVNQEDWSNEEALNNILMLSYCCNVVMIESRHEVWPYEYMTFSRRMGELWESFCKLCFTHPPAEDVTLFIPPLFDDVRKKLAQEIRQYIETLNITSEQRQELLSYYDKVWSLVTSGEIKLELDLHIEKSGVKYPIDFKSGFSSNEKGNTNRLLLVASIYKVLEENYQCLMFVRSEEDQSNRYLQVLRRSGLWDVSCGVETYKRIESFSGFDLRLWIDSFMDWKNDFKDEFTEYLISNNIDRYIKW